MPTSYSPNLALALMATGENDGSWGTIANTNLSPLIEEAIVVQAIVAMSDATTTITMTNGATCSARGYVLKLTGALTAQRNLVVPTINKPYIIYNTTTGGYGVQVITAAGTGVVVPNGLKRMLYVDGTNVVNAIDNFGSLTVTGTLTATAIENTPIGASTASTGRFSSLTVTAGTTLASLTVNNPATISGVVTCSGVIASGGDITGVDELTAATGIFSTSMTATLGTFNTSTTSGVCTAGSFVTSSDYRLKEDIEDAPEAWETVRALRVRRFRMKDDGKTRIGFVAHEAQEHVPEMVHGDKDGSTSQGVEPMVAVGLLTKALQEAMAKIERLEARLEDKFCPA